MLAWADAEPGTLSVAAAELGASFLPKPVSVAEVVEAVTEAARRASHGVR